MKARVGRQRSRSRGCEEGQAAAHLWWNIEGVVFFYYKFL
jgi:hypothetical protein